MSNDTDLEQYVRTPNRDELVKEVRAKINELGIRYIYYQFISVTGRIVGKGIPADHWERTAENGSNLSTALLLTFLSIGTAIILAMAQKRWNSLEYRILKPSANCHGTSAWQEYIAYASVIERNGRIQEHF